MIIYGSLYFMLELECDASSVIPTKKVPRLPSLWGIPNQYSCKTPSKVILYRSTLYFTEHHPTCEQCAPLFTYMVCQGFI